MKVKNLVLALAAVCVSLSVSAQTEKPQREMRKDCKMTVEQRVDMKTNAMVSKLMLKDSEKSQFTKTYKSFLTDLQKTVPADRCKAAKDCASCKEKGVKMNVKEKMLENKTDAEITKIIEERLTMEQARLDITKGYYKKFSAFLSPKQVACVLGSAKNNRPRNDRMNNNGPRNHDKSRRGVRK